MSVSCKEEFQLKNLGFGYEKPYQFSLSAWRCPHGAFVGWRVFWALWHLGWLIRSIQDQADEADGEKWFIFLTNWSFAILTFQSVLHLIVVLINTCKSRTSYEDFEHDVSTKWYEKLLWLFTSISFDAAIVVTVMYWAFIFEKLRKALNIVTHAVTTLYVLMDLFISASPTRFLHFVHGSLYGLVYGVFTLFYHFGDGTNNNGDPYVYDVLDWSNPGRSVGLIAGLMLVGTPVVHLFIFGLYTLRVYIGERCGCGTRKADGDMA